MLFSEYRRISAISNMVSQVSRFCVAPSLNLRQNQFFPFNSAVVPPIEVNPNLHSQFTHNFWYSRFFCSSRIVHSAVDAVRTGGRPSRKKKPAIHKSIIFAQAQKDLCDYFHNTRGYAFTDAEHISKNSPKFLQNILLKLKNDGSCDQSISRLLRFQPINEFEPFFESIGLHLIKHRQLLPKNLLYLSDDPVLLENYHVLCGYGVPRSKIGRIFMEAAVVFTYGEGVLISKLRKYENNGLSRAAIVKLITCCPHILIGEVDVNIIRAYEKLSNLGVDFNWVIQCLSEKSKCNWSQVSEMLTFLYRMGFDKEALATLIKETPVFVFHKSGKNIYLLVAILIKVGLKMDGILNLFVNNPHILIGKFVQNLGHSVIFLTEIGMELVDIANIISTRPEVLGSSPCNSSESVLQHLGLLPKNLGDMIKADPTKFTSLACTRSDAEPVHITENLYLMEKTEFLVKVGLAESSDEMEKLASKIRGRGDKLQERFDCLVKFGLDCHSVVKMVKTAPTILNLSVDALTKKIDYLTTELHYPLESLVDFPVFLCYKMDRVRLRFEMVRWLTEEKGLVPKYGEKFALSSLLANSEKRFTKLFVDVNPEWRNHYEMLKKSILGSDGIAN